MSSEMERIPDTAFCNDFASPTDLLTDCSDPGDCCASMKEEHIMYLLILSSLFCKYFFSSYDEATKQNTTDLIGRHGCKQDLNHIPHPEDHKCVEHQDQCYNVDLSTLPDNDNVTISNIELCFCTTDRQIKIHSHYNCFNLRLIQM